MDMTVEEIAAAVANQSDEWWAANGRDVARRLIAELDARDEPA